MEVKRRKRLQFDDIQPYFTRPIREAAEELDLSVRRSPCVSIWCIFAQSLGELVDYSKGAPIESTSYRLL